MTTHTDLIARLRDHFCDMSESDYMRAADALEAQDTTITALCAEIAALQSQMYEDRRQALVWRDQVAVLTKEREEFMRDYRRILIERGEQANIASAAQEREAKLHTMKDIAYRIVCDYARDNPIHEWMGVQQDPMGAHAWLEEFNNLLALPTDDSALTERLKQERERCAERLEAVDGEWITKVAASVLIRSMT